VSAPGLVGRRRSYRRRFGRLSLPARTERAKLGASPNSGGNSVLPQDSSVAPRDISGRPLDTRGDIARSGSLLGARDFSAEANGLWSRGAARGPSYSNPSPREALPRRRRHSRTARAATLVTVGAFAPLRSTADESIGRSGLMLTRCLRTGPCRLCGAPSVVTNK
jgi:hypothetical protein